MKKWFLLTLILGVVPLTMTAQDDMYFVPTKKSAQRAASNYGIPHTTYYSGSNRSVDEYNRRGGSHYEVMPGDSLNDIIFFNGERGVYPDSVTNDFELTREMSRFDGYETDNSFWAGYAAGRRDGWHSPWYYSSYYPWYTTWYDPLYYAWYDPWYYGWDGWYSPGRYYGYYGGYYGWGWGYPSHIYHGAGGGGHYRSGSLYSHNGNTGSIDRRTGSSHGRFTGYRGGSTASSTASSVGGSSRSSSARNRTVAGHTLYSNSSYSSGNSSFSSSSSSGNFSGARSSSSGSFSGGGGGGGGSFGGGGGGGGGSRGGSIRAGGRR